MTTTYDERNDYPTKSKQVKNFDFTRVILVKMKTCHRRLKRKQDKL